MAEKNPEIIDGRTLNISKGGVYCTTSQAVFEDTLIKILLEASDSKKFTIRYATVIGSEGEKEGNLVRCKFQEMELPPELRQLIDAAPLSEQESSCQDEKRQFPRHRVSWNVTLEVW